MERPLKRAKPAPDDETAALPKSLHTRTLLAYPRSDFIDTRRGTPLTIKAPAGRQAHVVWEILNQRRADFENQLGDSTTPLRLGGEFTGIVAHMLPDAVFRRPTTLATLFRDPDATTPQKMEQKVKIFFDVDSQEHGVFFIQQRPEFGPKPCLGRWFRGVTEYMSGFPFDVTLQSVWGRKKALLMNILDREFEHYIVDFDSRAKTRRYWVRDSDDFDDYIHPQARFMAEDVLLDLSLGQFVARHITSTGAKDLCSVPHLTSIIVTQAVPTDSGVEVAFQRRYGRDKVYVLTVRGLTGGLHEASPDMFDNVTVELRDVCFPFHACLIAQPNAFEFVVCRTGRDKDDEDPIDMLAAPNATFAVVPLVLVRDQSCKSLRPTALPATMRVADALHNIAVLHNNATGEFSVVEFGRADSSPGDGPAVHGGLRRRARARSHSRIRTRKSSRRSRSKMSSRRSRSKMSSRRSWTRKPS